MDNLFGKDDLFSLLQDLKNELTNSFGSNLVNIFLFGSQARNTETPDSDYDILILLKTKNKNELYIR